MIFYPILRYVISKSNYVRLYSTVNLPDIDVNYYCNAKNASEINNNIKIRKGVGDVNRVLNMYSILKTTPVTDDTHQAVRDNLYKELSFLPNKTHPCVVENIDPQVVQEINEKRDFKEYIPLEFIDITRRLNLLRTDKLGHTCGHKSYYFLEELAELEEALIKYTVSNLIEKKFQLVSVPDILPSRVLESCGMSINKDRTQVNCLLFYFFLYTYFMI